ncbi:MAG: L-histidine N(alpha)-methyltransferase [Gammaproteobacteria bacterium]
MKDRTVLAYRIQDERPEPDDFYREVITGLNRNPKQIAPKFFYDKAGSRLFEHICKQPEYYPTRVETGILGQYAEEIAGLAGKDGCLIEPGSGSCSKVRLLLDALRPSRYIPMDISCSHLHEAAERVAADFPWLDVHAVCADITRSVELPGIPEQAQRVVFYPGSSIGNYEPREAVEFLCKLAGLSGPGGGLLIGVDLQKESAILDDAYNDANGITAEFNLNLLHRINRELDADIDIDTFRHHAFYNETEGRVEMHLVSEYSQTLRIDGHSYEFTAGESIHTENSYKYTTEGFRALAKQAGFTAEAIWMDEEELFSLHFLRAA